MKKTIIANVKLSNNPALLVSARFLVRMNSIIINTIVVISEIYINGITLFISIK